MRMPTEAQLRAMNQLTRYLLDARFAHKEMLRFRRIAKALAKRPADEETVETVRSYDACAAEQLLVRIHAIGMARHCYDKLKGLNSDRGERT